MLKIIFTLADLLFPPSKEALLVRQIEKPILERLYRPKETGGIVSISSYQNISIQALITQNKFHFNKTAARILSQLLYRWLIEHYGTKNVILVPVPLSKERRLKRGHNQVETILSLLPAHHNFSIVPSLLQRVIDTPPQTSLTRAERLVNMTRAFTTDYAAMQKYKNTTIIIIDDVMTTGATVHAARATLAPHVPVHCTLHCVTLAH